MSRSIRRSTARVNVSVLVSGAIAAGVLGSAAGAQVLPPHPNAPKANWAQWERFSAANLRGLVFNPSINARWIGTTDSAFYNWRDRAGDHWYLVDATRRTKTPLFDREKLGTQLSALKKRTYDASLLNNQFTTINITKDHKHLRFAVDSERYNWNLATETLTSIGRYRGAQDSLLTKDEELDDSDNGGGGGGSAGVPCAQRPQGGPGGAPQDFRNWSPDSSAFVFARNYNLYFVDKAKGDTVQITREGMDRFSFGGGGGGFGGGGGGGGGAGGAPGRATRPNVVWSPDSRAFYTIRTDTRGVRDMYVVCSLTEPRPTLNQYQYSMPGEDSIPRPEMWTYVRGEAAAKKAPIGKWRDQRLLSGGRVGVGGGAEVALAAANQGYWVGKTGTTLRVVRRDRLQRNLELVELNVATGETKVIASDSKGEIGSLETNPPVYVKTGGDFLWFSERDGWGHYYLYSGDGKLKRQLTSGAWRADQVVGVDSIRQVAWIRGTQRERDENAYNRHLYRVSLLDGSIGLLDEGNYNHSSALSKNRKWIVDYASRVDTVPNVTLRDANTGRLVMNLEQVDVSRLLESGWRLPTSFTTLAADGVTRIHGNMWKPFDFDSTKKYPIIAYVYPGPQEEAVSGTFSASGGPQQLAQLGFIVIQIGNRGGTPGRSAAYQDFGYFDLRDYALADKKTGIEQLAARHKWIDIDRVGIYGHSGGGFLTGAAMLLPPYNEFFKVGVSESGNHDNNIYNQNWSEQYHGLKWVAASDTARLTAEARSKGRNAEFLAGYQIGRGEAGQGGGGAAARGGARGARGGQTAGQQGAGGEATTAAATGTAAAVPDSVFWIYVPTNIDIAANLKGKLLLNTGDEDNNVSPSNTIRLVNALIKSGKRFDFMVFPGVAHSYASLGTYPFQMVSEYFAEFLLGDNQHRMSSEMSRHRP